MPERCEMQRHAMNMRLHGAIGDKKQGGGEKDAEPAGQRDPFPQL